MKPSLVGLIGLGLGQVVFDRFFFFPQNYTLFNVRDLQSAYDQRMPFNYSGQLGELKFNLVEDLIDAGNCRNDVSAARAIFVPSNSVDCPVLLFKDNNLNTLELLDTSQPDQGFRMFKNAEDVRWLIHCNPSMKKATYTIQGNEVHVESANSCGHTLSWLNFMDSHRWVLSLVMVLVGAILVLFGGIDWFVFLAISIYFILTFLLTFALWATLGFTDNAVFMVIEITLIGFASLAIVYVSRRLREAWFSIVGFLAGTALAFLLLKILLHFSSSALVSLSILVCGLVFGFIFYSLKERSLMYFYTYVGTFLIVFYLFYLFHYSEGIVMDLIRIWRSEQFCWPFWLSAGLGLPGAVIGAELQKRKLKEEEKSVIHHSLLN